MRMPFQSWMHRINKRLLGATITATMIAATAGQAAENYSIDGDHTEVRFEYYHLGLSTQSGEFDGVEGTLQFDKENVANSSLNVTIQVDSIDTGVEALDTHLKSADFFEAEKFPTMTFKSSSIKQTGVDQGQVIGDLTMKGVTKPVTLDVTFNFEGEHPLSPYLEWYKDAYYTGFSARGQLLRSDWGITFAAPLTADKIDIIIEAELRKDK